MKIRVQIIGTAIFAFPVIGLFVYFVVLPMTRNSPDIGFLTEQVYQWSDEDGSLPKFTEVASIWGLDEWQNTSKKQLRGAVAIADINNDGVNDIILGGGGLAIFLSSKHGKFISVANSENITIDEVVSVGYGDVDGDEILDILIGTDGDEDVIIWGGDWIENYDMAGAELTVLPGGKITTNLIAAELSGDEMIDILSLGFGSKRSVSRDVIFEQTSPRNFKRIVLPNSRRYTLAAEVADINADGELDIWVTRDVGWRQGPDSLYARINESWQDQANILGTDLRVDGMDVTIADYNNDGTLDAYVSDVGDNELLLNNGKKFVKASTLGLARIRPVGSDMSIISSSWASGIADFNLDGRLDLLVVNGGFRDDLIENKIDGTDI
ncbi:VCBS repeat-containing protein, partial [Patescibacteria group bacterium]|nr:VCBS repeat-containing protein [Patescibacteria group bacterium]